MKKKLPKICSVLLIFILLTCSAHWQGLLKAEEGDGSSDLVESKDWREVFENSGAVIDPSDTQHLTLVSSYPDEAYLFPTEPTTETGKNCANVSISSYNKLSLLCDWEFTVQTDVERNDANRVNFCLGFDAVDFEIYEDSTKCQMSVIEARQFPHFEDIAIDQSDLTNYKDLKVQYNAANKMFTFTLSNHILTYSADHFLWGRLSDEKTVTVRMSGYYNYVVSKGQPDNTRVRCRFVNAKYTSYSPSFEETVILDPDTGKEFDDPSLIQPGTVVIVQSEIKNRFTPNGSPVPVHVKLLTDNKKYPTNGLEPLTEGQQIYVDGTLLPDSETIDIKNDGIPATCKPEGTTVRYYATIQDTQGKAVTIGQSMADDFFQSKQYSGATLVPEMPLEPMNPENPEGEPGKDYHYDRTPPNTNGWNNSDIDLNFYKGDYNQFIVEKPVDEDTAQTVVSLDATAEKEKVTSFTDETSGSAYIYQAKDTVNVRQSAKQKDLVKIDKTIPQIALSSTGTGETAGTTSRTLKLTDNLSGIWKLQKKNASGKFEEIRDYTDNLTDGNGNKSETYTGITNGIYRVMDAAGNLSEPFDAYVTQPPAITPSGPDAEPLPKPEITETPEGLRHAVYRDSIAKLIKKPYDFEGKLTAERALDFIKERYQFTSHAEDPALTEKLTITSGGKDITASGFTTTRPGDCTICLKITDAEGNTSTIYLDYRLTENMAPPTVIDKPGGTPLTPSQVTESEDGTRHAVVRDTMTEYVKSPDSHDKHMDAESAKDYLSSRYLVNSGIDKPENLTLGNIKIYDLNNNREDITQQGIDLTRPGSYLIVLKVTDSYGNTTTLEFTYILKAKEEALEHNISISGGSSSDIVSGRPTAKTTKKITYAGLSRPQTGDSLLDPGCRLHIYMLLGIVLTMCIGFPRLIFAGKHKRKPQGLLNSRTAGMLKYLFYAASLFLITCCVMMRNCLFELPLALLWTALIFILMLADGIKTETVHNH